MASDGHSNEIRWLNADEQHAWRALAAIITRLPAQLDTQLQRDSKLTHFDYWVMALLSENPDRRLQLAQLARYSNASLSRLSHVITKLENAGWVQRQSVVGSRSAFAYLTDAGLEKVVASAPGHVETVRRYVFDGLSKAQVGQLAKVGWAIAEQLDCALEADSGKD